jgi:L-erythro-3,5-diaminohexanoate dehydrogenase
VNPLSPYGLHRVVGQPGVLPQAAQRLDASLPCQATELELSVEQIYIDSSSFHQLRGVHHDDASAMREALLALVKDRGKLHNSVTNSGGMLTGVVRMAGAGYPSAPVPGTRVASLVSLTLTPLRLDFLGEVDLRTSAIAARGAAFLFETGIWIELPTDIHDQAAVAAFDVAGAPARVRARTRPGDRVLIIGAGHSGALSAVAAAEAGAAQVLVADVDAARLARLEQLDIQAIRPLLGDARDAVAFAELVGAPADLTVSCVNVPGIETACILSTRRDGHILFFSMATDFTRAALGAEGVGSGATLEIGNGFLPGHAAYAVDLLRRHPALSGLLRSAQSTSRRRMHRPSAGLPTSPHPKPC